MRSRVRVIAPLKLTEYGVYGDLLIFYPKPYSISLRGDYSSERISPLNFPEKSKLGTTFMRTLSESLSPLDLYGDLVQQI